VRSCASGSSAGKSLRVVSIGDLGRGLTSARDVGRSHGGDVRLETSPHGGLRARIHLPR
jgi:two-component system osmolarity sensor histidine kinase EnvZ